MKGEDQGPVLLKIGVQAGFALAARGAGQGPQGWTRATSRKKNYMLKKCTSTKVTWEIDVGQQHAGGSNPAARAHE